VSKTEKGCCRPLGEAESAFFSKEAVLRKYESFKTLIEKETSAEKPLYLEDFLREANVSRGQKVLEIGVNPGYLAIYLSKIVGNEGKVVLAELDGIITADAERNIKEHKAQSILEVTEAKIEKLPFPSNFFDVVVSDRTTSLLKHKSALISEMARVLVTGGRIVVADCVLRKAFSKTQVERSRQSFACLFQAAGVEEYVTMLKKSGFQQAKIIMFIDEECTRPHFKMKEEVHGHIGFAIICGKKGDMRTP
jgi:ubiquinone/menaquinone biosynthesis C-methylase UbiE